MNNLLKISRVFFALGVRTTFLRGDFVRPKQRRQIQRDRSKRHEEREVEEPEPKEKTVPKPKAAKARRVFGVFLGGVNLLLDLMYLYIKPEGFIYGFYFYSYMDS